MKKLSSAVLCSLALLMSFAGTPVQAQGINPPANLSYVGGKFYARRYAYPGVRVFSGNNNAGAATITLSQASVRLADGRTIVPFSAGGYNILGQPGSYPAIPITIGAGATKETVTPTAVSGCYVGAPQGVCSITATFAQAHGMGDVVVSGSAGIQEAINDASFFGGGVVVVDGAASSDLGGASAVSTAINAAIPMPNVSIEDDRQSAPAYWNVAPTATTFMAVPTTLISTTVASNLGLASGVAGSSSWGSTTYACVTYVDIMGNEGPCSATYNFTSTTLQAIGFTAPAASAGAVGYKIYLSLSGGSYAAAYDIPLLTQPSVALAVPASAGVCTLTTIETITPACALTNTTYGQVGVGAVVTGYPVVTSQLAPQLGSVSTTSDYVPNSNAHTVYSYVEGSHLAVPGFTALSEPFTVVTTGAATTVPETVGLVQIPAGYMNQVGRGIRVCGFGTSTGSTTATVIHFQTWWDAEGSNVTAGTPVLVGDVVATPGTALAATSNYHFCQDIVTTVASASATGGSLFALDGFSTMAQVTAGANPGAGINKAVAAVSSLNLGLNARLQLIYLHTTGTDASGFQLLNVTVQALN